MRRLYLKIYLTIIASLVLVVLVAGAVWRWRESRRPAGVRNGRRAASTGCCPRRCARG